jgi:hypothetical protein
MPFMAFLTAILLITGMPVAGLALPTWPLRGDSNKQTPLESKPPSGRLQEVAPPGAVQQLREKLQRYQPNLRLVTPTDDSVINADTVELILDVKNWPISRDDQLGLGPHVVVQIDNQPPRQLHELEANRVSVRLNDLAPGSHRFSAWAAYPWGEAVKTPGANLQGRFHLWQRMEGTQPGSNAPWLVPVTNSADPALQPLLLDWLIWNAPLQNLRDGDGRWRLRLSVDGDSFLVDHQEALWLKGNSSSRGNLVQMELLNGVGEPITPEFNNRLIHQSGQRATSPTWLKAHLTEEELTRLSGAPRIPSADLETEAIDKPEPLLNRTTKPEAKPVSSAKAVSESPNGDEAKPDSDIEPTPGARNVQEAAKAPEAETAPGAEQAADTKKGATTLIESDPTTSPRNDALVDEQDTPEQTNESAYKQSPDVFREDVMDEDVMDEDVMDEDVVDKDVVKENLVSEDIAPPNEPKASDDQAPRLQRDNPSMPVPSASEERLVPTSRLGGSARELLNDDGSLRKP